MYQIFTRVQSTQKTQSRPRTRRTALSLFIGGLFYSAAPAWADCTVTGTPNANGGVDMTCEGVGITQDTSLLGNQSNNNTVTVQGEGTTIAGIVFGGSGDVTVMGNTVTFNDSSRSNYDVFGGYVFGSDSGDVTVTGNSVTFNGGSGSGSGSVSGGDAFGFGDVTVMGNTVTFNDSSASGSGSVNGGYGYGYGDVTIIGNTVTFNDSSRSNYDVYGGSGSGNDSGSGDVTVTGNSVAFNGSSRGNYDAYGGAGYGSGSGDVTVTGNSVTFNGSSGSSSVYAGYGYGYGDVTVTGNTVNIHDNAKVTGNLYGAFIENSRYANRYDGFTGNTLNFAAAPITISGEMANFENYNFTVDPALVNTDTALITAQTITFGTNDTNMKGGEDNSSKIQVVGIKAGNELYADDKFVLMQATGTMSGNAEGLTTNGVAQQGISLLYDVRTDVDTDGKLVTATIIGKEKPVTPVEPPVTPVEPPVVPPVEPGKPAARVNPQLKSLSEGHLASAMILTRGADTLAYDTINTIKQQNPENGWAPFINLSGDKTRYNSGSHINAKDALLTGGVSYQADKLTSAVLIESGWGSYDTHNSFTTMNSVKGDGHNRYLGLGVLGRYDFESGVYADASLRGGKNRNNFDTKDIQNLTTGERVHYNLDSNYVSAHVGTGYTKALDEKNTLDVSAKYLWTQLKGKDVKIAGDNIHFDDINSHRVRLNAGIAHQSTKALQLRTGLGYEYELDGKAKATTYDYDIAAPSVQGSTAIMTVGATMTPMANQAFSIDVNANGYTGQRDGIGGNIKFSYAF